MMRHCGEARMRGLAFAISFVASVFALPAMSQTKDPKAAVTGCTGEQVRSAQAVACGVQRDKDMAASLVNFHLLRCTGAKLECCIKTPDGWGGCEPALVAPRPEEHIAQRSPATPDPLCAALKTEKGVWTPDPKSIKANADKKTCSQVYTCGAPPADKLSADEKKCTPVVTVSHKEVTQTGTCVPGSTPGTCSSCLANAPNDPCNVAFKK
jgi:hypothetical protein